MEKGAINENDLMMKLVNAKKVMNKVDSGNYTKGNVSDSFTQTPEELMNSQEPARINQNRQPVVGVNESRIRESKLPDAIKNAMIEHPIQQISLNDSLDMGIIEGAKKLMEREGLKSKPQQTNQHVSNNSQVQTSSSLNEDIKSLIRETIKDTLEEIIDKKLNLILTAQQTASINENLVLKVGDSIFKGKITGVNKSK